MTLERAILELDADVDPNTTGLDNGVFEMVGNLEVDNIVTPSFVVGGTGTTLHGIIQSSLDTVGGWVGVDDSLPPQKRAGLHLDLGGGRHQYRLQFIGWDGATDSNGNNLTWGDTSQPAGTAANGTGEDALRQMQVLGRYLQQGEYDSRAERARLKFGEYHPNGLYEDYLHVAVENANFNKRATEEHKFDGALTVSETIHWNRALDTIKRFDL